MDALTRGAPAALMRVVKGRVLKDLGMMGRGWRQVEGEQMMEECLESEGPRSYLHAWVTWD